MFVMIREFELHMQYLLVWIIHRHISTFDTFDFEKI